VAGAKIRQTTAHAGHSGAVEATTVAADPAETEARTQPLSRRRQPTRLPHPVAPVITQESTQIQHERKSHETRNPLPKPIALSQEQSKKRSPNPPGETEIRLSSDAIRRETENRIA
jgi:hypothetical protein